jgi:predicted YcjX-like family ATPase
VKTVGIYLTDHLVRFGYVAEIDRQPVLIDKEIPLDSSKPQDIAAAIRNVFKSDKIQNDRTVLFLPRIGRYS